MPPRIPLPFSRIARPKSSPCIFCQSQQFPPLQRAKHTKPSKETVVTHKNPIRIDPIQREKVVRGRVSFDRDRELRRNVYEGARERKHINLEPDEAEALITQFTHGVPIEQIITKFNITRAQLTALAIPLLSAGGSPTDTYNHDIGFLLLGACSKAQDPLATLHIMSTHYMALAHHQTSRVSTILLPSELFTIRRHLESLAHDQNNAEACALLAQFLDHEGKPKKAAQLYQKAIDLWDISVLSATSNTMAPRIASPWAQYYLLLQSLNAPKELCLEVLEKGAEAEDPMSYYHLSTLQNPNSWDWMQYLTRAAASGHPDAMFDLGEWYISYDPVIKFLDPKLASYVSWLKPNPKGDKAKDPKSLTGTAEALGWEWHGLAAKAGNKRSMLRLAKWMVERGQEGAAARWLIKVSTPRAYSDERDKRFVREGRAMLRGLKEGSKIVKEILEEAAAAARK